CLVESVQYLKAGQKLYHRWSLAAFNAIDYLVFEIAGYREAERHKAAIGRFGAKNCRVEDFIHVVALHRRAISERNAVDTGAQDHVEAEHDLHQRALELRRGKLAHREEGGGGEIEPR